MHRPKISENLVLSTFHLFHLFFFAVAFATDAGGDHKTRVRNKGSDLTISWTFRKMNCLGELPVYTALDPICSVGFLKVSVKGLLLHWCLPTGGKYQQDIALSAGAGQWSKRGVCKVHTSGLRLVNRPLHLYLVKFAHRWLWAHWCSLAAEQVEQQKWKCRCYKDDNFLKGTIDSIGWSFPNSPWTTLHALIGGSSWSMTSSMLEDTFGKSSLQVSTSGSFRAVLTKSLYVTWQNGYVGQPNKVATSKMGTCSGMWKNSLCSSSSLTSSAPEKSILTCWWKSRSLKNSPWFFRKLINCCLQIVRTLGQVKETLSVHLGHMFMCLISTWWSWAPQLGLQLGPFQSPVNISSEEEDLTEKEKWIWKS